MLINEFDYELPPELIAQQPCEQRGDSRMLVLDPASGSMEIMPFARLPEFLGQGDSMVINNTKVIRARLFARKETGAKIEIFLLGMDAAAPRKWQCFMKPAKRVSPGTALQLMTRAGGLSPWAVTLIAKEPDGTCCIEFDSDPDPVLHACGHLPLPPYIKRDDAELDSERYQTIYASTPGAVAAPTAGLHFTPETFAALKEKAVNRVDLTLHVGAGTFKPVDVDVVEDHKMHSERFFFTPEASTTLNATRSAGHKILAVGTTSLRTLESCVDADGVFAPRSGETDIFIYPPYHVRSADMLLTNFHLPKSTLLMLVSAFAGMDLIRKAYSLAIQERMRFFSYGDCMLILNKV